MVFIYWSYVYPAKRIHSKMRLPGNIGYSLRAVCKVGCVNVCFGRGGGLFNGEALRDVVCVTDSVENNREEWTRSVCM